MSYAEKVNHYHIKHIMYFQLIDFLYYITFYKNILVKIKSKIYASEINTKIVFKKDRLQKSLTFTGELLHPPA